MSNQNSMQMIMIGLLLLCGYLYLFQLTARRTENKSSIPFVAIILLLIYLAVSVPVILIIQNTGSTEMILNAILLLFACVALFISLYGMVRHFREINKGMLALFLVYTLAVAYITIFSRERIRGSSTGKGGVYLFRFEMIQEAVRTRSLEPIKHMLLNVAMFVPFGVLLPMIYPEKMSRWSYALILGLMYTIIIEFTQMLLRLGQADLTDILTNAVGAVIGYLLYSIFSRIRRDRLDKAEE